MSESNEREKKKKTLVQSQQWPIWKYSFNVQGRFLNR